MISEPWPVQHASDGSSVLRRLATFGAPRTSNKKQEQKQEQGTKKKEQKLKRKAQEKNSRQQLNTRTQEKKLVSSRAQSCVS
jgi:hypothetical protein